MTECTIPTNKSLDEILILLNRLLLQADQYKRVLENPLHSDKSKAIHFGQQFDSFKKNVKNLDEKNTFIRLNALINIFKDYYQTTSGRYIFYTEKRY